MNHTRRIVQLGLRRCFATESAGSGKTAENAVITLRSGRQFRRKEHDLITMEEAKMWKDMTRGEKIVYATKQTSYAGIILAGLGITGSLAYVVGSELFSSNNASGVYSRALTMVKNNQEICDILGTPISGFQEHRRGSWKKLLTQADSRTGKKIGYLKFGISGPVAEGTVQVYLTENEKGSWEYTLVSVSTPYKTVIVKDERQPIMLDELPQPQ